MARRILVVEDDLLNRMFYIATLEQAGCEVEAVGDGAKVLESVERFRPDLVVMDIDLPHVSGLQLIERLKADPARKATPILAITAYVGRAEERMIREAGADDFLPKPVTVKGFVGALERLLSRAPDRPGAVGRERRS